MEYFASTAILGVVICIIVFLMNKRSKKIIDTSVCADKNCVRCTKYAEIKERSFVLYRKHINDLPKSDFDKLYRIQSSVDMSDNVLEGKQRPNVFLLQGLKSEPWPVDLASSLEHDIAKIEQNAEMINDEMDNIIETQANHWLVNNTPQGDWEVFHLINQGKVVNKNVKLAPKTFKLVSKLASVMTNTVFGNVSFSIVYPGTTISDHYGPTNIRLRCHLG